MNEREKYISSLTKPILRVKLKDKPILKVNPKERIKKKVRVDHLA